MAKTTAKFVIEEITVENLTVGSLIKHKKEWLPVNKIIFSNDIEEFEDQLIIYTSKGVALISYPFETVEVKVC